MDACRPYNVCNVIGPFQESSAKTGMLVGAAVGDNGGGATARIEDVWSLQLMCRVFYWDV